MKNNEIDIALYTEKKIEKNQEMDLSQQTICDDKSDNSPKGEKSVRSLSPQSPILNKSQSFIKKRYSEVVQSTNNLNSSYQDILPYDLDKNINNSQEKVGLKNLTTFGHQPFRPPKLITQKDELQNEKHLKSFRVSSRSIFSGLKIGDDKKEAKPNFWAKYQLSITQNYEEQRIALKNALQRQTSPRGTITGPSWSYRNICKLASISRNPSFDMCEVKGNQALYQNKKSIELSEAFQILPQPVEEKLSPRRQSSICKIDGSALSILEDDLFDPMIHQRFIQTNAGELLENEIYEVVESCSGNNSVQLPIISSFYRVEDVLKELGPSLPDEQGKFIRFRNKLRFMLQHGLIDSKILFKFSLWAYSNLSYQINAFLEIFDIDSLLIRKF